MTEKSAKVLESLRANAEERTVNPGPGWFMVYLDNARPDGMSETQFRSCLAVLSKRGQYKVVDGWAWGEVFCE